MPQVGESCRSSAVPGGPLRILHVLGSLDRGGAETWLVHLLRQVAHNDVSMDFVVYDNRKYDYTDEIEALGGRIYPVGRPSNPLRYVRNLQRVLEESGPYQVVHSHLNELSGVVLLSAKATRIPVRVAHSHIERNIESVSLARRLSYPTLRRLIGLTSNLNLGASVEAATSVFGQSSLNDMKTSVLHCGIDLRPFSSTGNEPLHRGELGILPNDLVVGHVGRFADQKNHMFLMKIAEELVRLNSRVKILLVGRGPLEDTIRSESTSLGISDHVIFAGVRDDVPMLMRDLMDVFVFPSKFEGLGLTVVEAQAAGLPAVVSDRIPREADVLPGMVSRIPLESSPAEWAKIVLQSLNVQPECDPLEAVIASDFNIERSAARLLDLYRSALQSNK